MRLAAVAPIVEHHVAAGLPDMRAQGCERHVVWDGLVVAVQVDVFFWFERVLLVLSFGVDAVRHVRYDFLCAQHSVGVEAGITKRKSKPMQWR